MSSTSLSRSNLIHVASVLIGTLSFLRFLTPIIGRIHVGKRRKCANNEEDQQNAFQRPIGLLEGWYHAQLPGRGQRMFFVIAELSRPSSSSAANASDAIPTRQQLWEAVSNVAAKHPILTAYNASDGIVRSQLQCDGPSSDTIRWPLECFRDCVIEQELSSTVSYQEAIANLVRKELNEPLPDLPARLSTGSSSSSSNSTYWHGIKLILMRRPASDAKAQRFDLLIRIPHVIGDGMSGMVLMRHVLHELDTIMKHGSNVVVPATRPISSLAPLSSYPALDDLFDCRTTVRRVFQFVCEEVWHLPDVWRKVRSVFIRPPDVDSSTPSWKGSFEPTEATRGQFAEATEFETVQFDAQSTAQLHARCKEQGCTIHSALVTAAAMASEAIVSSDRAHHIDVASPYSLRRMCSEQSTVPVADLIGNYLYVVHYPYLIQKRNQSSVTSSSSSTVSSSSSSLSNFWTRTREYQSTLRREMVLSAESLGLIGFVDIVKYVRDQCAKHFLQRGWSMTISNLGEYEYQQSLPAASTHQSSSAAAAKNRVHEDCLSGFNLHAFRFVQPCHYHAAVFVHNVSSCVEGGLSNMISWPGGVITQQEASTYARQFQQLIHDIIQTAARPSSSPPSSPSSLALPSS